jgi:hypothetical protein
MTWRSALPPGLRSDREVVSGSTEMVSAVKNRAIGATANERSCMLCRDEENVRITGASPICGLL